MREEPKWVSVIRREAKDRTKKGEKSHKKNLDEIARELNYKNWDELKRKEL